MSREGSEIAGYFRGLLDHQRRCDSAACSTCDDLERMLGLVREQIFSSALQNTGGGTAPNVTTRSSRTKVLSAPRRVRPIR